MSTTPVRRGVRVRARRRAARGVPGITDAGLLLQVDDAVLMHEADTMLSKQTSWEDYRRWAQLRGGRAEPRAARAARAADQVPHLLRQLARAARLRPAAGATRSTSCSKSGRSTTRSSRPTRGTSTSGRSGKTSRCPRTRYWSPAWSLTTPMSSSTPSSSRSAWSGWRTWSGATDVMGGHRLRVCAGLLCAPGAREIQWAKLASLVEGARIASRELWGVKAEA